MTNEILTGVKTAAMKSIFKTLDQGMVKFELEDGTTRNLLFSLRAFSALAKLTQDIAGAYDVELLRYSEETPELVTDVIIIEKKEEKIMGRMAILAEFLAIEFEEGEDATDYVSEIGDNEFEAEGNTYLVLTDDEADEKAKEYILESLWAFNAEFLASNTELPVEVFEALQEKCEDANETFKTLIEKCGDLDELVSEAISSDGRAHFMNTYDDQENELGEYYIYRIN